MAKIDKHEPVRAAQRIVGKFVELRDSIKVTAEGFAVLDFVQGHVAADLPATTARDIIAVMRGERELRSDVLYAELVMLWLENYRRAYSQMIMRVLEDGSSVEAHER